MRVCLAVFALCALASCATHSDTHEDVQVISTETIDVSTARIAGQESVVVRIEAPADPRGLAIFLHGVGADETYWSTLHEGAGASALARAGILVASPKGDAFGWPETIDGTTTWEGFLLYELIADLKAIYELDNAPVALFGVSAGGAESLTLSFRQPDRVDCVAALSPAIHWPDPSQMFGWAKGWDGWAREFGDPIDPKLWRARNPIALASNPGVNKIGVYFETGEEDHLNFDETSIALSEALNAAGVAHHFSLQPGGHGTSFYRSRVGALEQFLVSCLSVSRRSTSP